MQPLSARIGQFSSTDFAPPPQEFGQEGISYDRASQLAIASAERGPWTGHGRELMQVEVVARVAGKTSIQPHPLTISNLGVTELHGDAPNQSLFPKSVRADHEEPGYQTELTGTQCRADGTMSEEEGCSSHR
jgi:hypothetical protein